MIIIVMGLPGSGKSYFASRLAELIHAGYISSDRVRKSMYTDRSYSEKEKYSVYQEMLELMRQAIKQDRDLVLDATFYKNDIRKTFTDEARKGGGVSFIEVKADEAVIKERLKQSKILLITLS
jgi:predicted kinase